MTRDEATARKFEVQTNVGDHFAWLRTRLAIENTLLSWLRSATGLIGFGFTIVQVIERLQTATPNQRVLLPEMARNLGLALIAAGVVALAVAFWEYGRLVKYLWSGEFRTIAGITEKPHRTPLIAVAVLVEIVGLIAFLTVLFRLS